MTTVITANMARRISINSKLGFLQVVNHVIHSEASIGKTDAKVTIPRALYDMQQEIRDELEGMGYEVLIETRQGCCMPDDRIMYLNWGFQA